MNKPTNTNDVLQRIIGALSVSTNEHLVSLRAHVDEMLTANTEPKLICMFVRGYLIEYASESEVIKGVLFWTDDALNMVDKPVVPDFPIKRNPFEVDRDVCPSPERPIYGPGTGPDWSWPHRTLVNTIG